MLGGAKVRGAGSRSSHSTQKRDIRLTGQSKRYGTGCNLTFSRYDHREFPLHCQDAVGSLLVGGHIIAVGQTLKSSVEAERPLRRTNGRGGNTYTGTLRSDRFAHVLARKPKGFKS